MALMTGRAAAIGTSTPCLVRADLAVFGHSRLIDASRVFQGHGTRLLDSDARTIDGDGDGALAHMHHVRGQISRILGFYYDSAPPEKQVGRPNEWNPSICCVVRNRYFSDPTRDRSFDPL